MMMRDEIMAMISEYIFEIERQEMISPEHVNLSVREVVWQLGQLNDRIYKKFSVEREIPRNEFQMLQSEVGGWAETNFGRTPAHRALLGVIEEVGELAHAQLKKEQGVRKGPELFVEDASDAIGDILIYLAHFCAITGLSLQGAVDNTWAKVRQRDWKKYPETGMPCNVEGELIQVTHITTKEGGE